jgi:hypothetical protein
MISAAITIALHGAAPRLPFLAQAHAMDGVGIGAAILLTLIGVILSWSLPRKRMSLEEHVKDGDMTDDEARRHLRFYERCAPIATLAGVMVLLYVMYDLTH